MKQIFIVTICNQKFEAKSYTELHDIVKNDVLLNTWLTNSNQKIADFYPTTVITKRLFCKPKTEVIDYYYEIDPIDYWTK